MLVVGSVLAMIFGTFGFRDGLVAMALLYGLHRWTQHNEAKARPLTPPPDGVETPVMGPDGWVDADEAAWGQEEADRGSEGDASFQSTEPRKMRDTTQPFIVRLETVDNVENVGVPLSEAAKDFFGEYRHYFSESDLWLAELSGYTVQVIDADGNDRAGLTNLDSGIGGVSA